MKNKTRCIVLLSGGQDSATALFWAKYHWDEVLAVSFNYGQKHLKELEYASQLAKIADVALHHVFNLSDSKVLYGSSLVNHKADHNQAHPQDSSLPASFTPARNLLFLTLASGFAYNMGISDLITGVCQTDYSGYPDCRRVFIDSAEVSVSLALSKDFRIHTPLMYLNKAEIWKMAYELGPDVFEAIRTKTMTDYNGDETENYWGMGRLDNPASVIRKKGYDEAFNKGWIGTKPDKMVSGKPDNIV